MIFFADVSKSVTGKTNVGWVEINSRFKVSCSYVMIIEVPTLDLKINYIFNNCKQVHSESEVYLFVEKVRRSKKEMIDGIFCIYFFMVVLVL